MSFVRRQVTLHEMGGESGDLVAQTLGWDGRNLLGEKENKNPVELRHF